MIQSSPSTSQLEQIDTIDEIPVNVHWNPKDKSFQNQFKIRLYLAFMVFLGLITGHILLFLNIRNTVIINDGSILKLCDTIEEIRIYSTNCIGELTNSNTRILVILAYWFVMVTTWGSMLYQNSIKKTKFDYIGNRIIQLSYLMRLTALYCYASYNSEYDYTGEKVIENYYEANDYLYFSILGVSGGCAILFLILVNLMMIIPTNDQPVIIPHNSYKIWIFRIIFLFFFWSMLFVFFYFIYLINFAQVQITDLIKPRGPNLVSITILIYYQIISSGIEYLIIFPLSLKLKISMEKHNKLITQKFKEDYKRVFQTYNVFELF